MNFLKYLFRIYDTAFIFLGYCIFSFIITSTYCFIHGISILTIKFWLLYIFIACMFCFGIVPIIVLFCAIIYTAYEAIKNEYRKYRMTKNEIDELTKESE